MKLSDVLAGVILVALAVLGWLSLQGQFGKAKPDCPDGVCPIPKPDQPQNPTRRPLLPFMPREEQQEGPANGVKIEQAGPVGQVGSLTGESWSGPTWRDGKAFVGTSKNPDGTEAHIDLPARFHVQNRGGSDGAGLCVYASARHSGIWHDEPVFQGLFEWMFKHPGGSWPEKFDKSVEQFCSEKGLAKPAYTQVIGSDLELLGRATRAGLFPGVTYWYSPTGRYGGRRISHMVSLVHCDEKWCAILDNNYPGSIEWMTPQQFLSVFKGPSKEGWAIIPLRPGPPPVPVNRGGK